MEELKETGGAKIGMGHATWPFAKLTVNRNMLEMNVSVIGKVIFKPTDIISIVPGGFIRGGIKINHSVASYNSNVVFYQRGNSKQLIKEIEQTGFLDNMDPIPAELEKEIDFAQSTGSFPVKPASAIIVVVIWNLLFFYDMRNSFWNDQPPSPIGIGAWLAMGFMVLLLILLLIAPPVQKLILKEGRNVSDIKSFIYFALFIFGVMFLVLSLQMISFLKPS